MLDFIRLTSVLTLRPVGGWCDGAAAGPSISPFSSSAPPSAMSASHPDSPETIKEIQHK